jgi:hypothetical protein
MWYISQRRDRMKIRLCLITVLSLMLTISCHAFGSNADSDTQHLRRDTWSTGDDRLVLSFGGPTSGTSSPVTYFIFGSDSDLGDGGMVPLAMQRMDETAFGPLGFGERIDDVDLSPWAAYDHVYLRAIPVQPNLIHKLSPGHIYHFYTN